MQERNEDSIRCFREADGCLLISYLNEPLIREAAESVWTSLCSLTENDPSMKEEYTKAKNKIDSLTKKQQESPSNEYDTIISSQERSFVSQTIFADWQETYDSFFRACKKNSLRQVIRYIHQGLDLNFVNPQTKYTALHQACWYGHSDIVMLLLQHGADPSIKNAYVLSFMDRVYSREKRHEIVLCCPKKRKSWRFWIGLKRRELHGCLPVKSVRKMRQLFVTIKGIHYRQNNIVGIHGVLQINQVQDGFYISHCPFLVHHKSSVYQFYAVDRFKVVIREEFITHCRYNRRYFVRIVKIQRKLNRLFNLCLCESS